MTQYAIVKNEPVMKFTKMHHDYLVAKQEAERLAIKEPGQFLLMEVIGIVERTAAPVKWIYPSLKNDT